MNRISPDFLLLLVALIWGSGFIAADIAIDYWPPILITALRFSVASLLYLFIYRPGARTRQEQLHRNCGPGLLVGTLLALGFIMQTMGLNYTTPARNAFLTTTNVIIIPFLHWIFSRKMVEGRTLLGALLSVIGIGILNYDGTAFSLNNLGDILTLICAVFFALHIYSTGFYLREKSCDLQTMVLLQFISAAAVSWLAVLVFEREALDSLWALLWAMGRSGGASDGLKAAAFATLYLGLFPTLLCHFLQNFAQQKVTQSKAAILLSLEALFGSLFSVLLRGEILTVSMFLSFGLMFLAILLVEVKRISLRRTAR